MAASHLSLRVKNIIPDPAEDPDNRALVTTLKPQCPPKSAALLLGLLGLCREEAACRISPSRTTLPIYPDQQQCSPAACSAGAAVLSAARRGRGVWDEGAVLCWHCQSMFAAGGRAVRLLSCPAHHLQGRPPHRTRRELMGCESHTRVVGPTNALTGQPFG